MVRRLPKKEVNALRASLGITPLEKAKKPKKEKPKPIPATKLTIDECERRGWIAQTVEQVIPHTFIKRDLFGVIDIIAVAPGLGIVGIQASSGTNLHGRRAKILAEPRMADWLNAGGRLQLWTWTKTLDAKLRPVFSLRVEQYGASGDRGVFVEDREVPFG